MPVVHAPTLRLLSAGALASAACTAAHADHPAGEAFYGIEIHEWVVALGGTVPANAADFHANSAGRSIIGHGAILPVVPVQDTVTVQLVVEGHLHRPVEEGGYFEVDFLARPVFDTGSMTMVSAAMEATGDSHDMLHHTLFTQGGIGPRTLESNVLTWLGFTTSPFAESHADDAAAHDGDVLGDFIFVANFVWTDFAPADLMGIVVPEEAFRITYVPAPGPAACAASLAILALRRRR